MKLDFVFMATCHSQFAAEIFLTAGAHHVIGINLANTIQDSAILTFTQTFYSKLWKEKSKICVCFHAAKLAVSIKNGKQQAEYFILFQGKKTQHNTKDCVIYGNFQRGEPQFKKEKTRLWDKAPRINRLNGHEDLV